VRASRWDRRALVPVALLALWLVLLVLVVTEWGPLHRLDLRVAADLHAVAVDHPGQVTWWKWVSRVVDPDVERIAWAVGAVVLWLAKRARAAIFVVVVLAGAAVLEGVVKLAVARHRPVFAHAVASAVGKSFPSGHALGAVVAFGLLVLLVPRRFALAAAVLGTAAVLLVSYSRLALGVHYLTDVVGGWLLGAAWLLLADWLLRPDKPPL
jgi:undecaprenyl-diphosphatase